MEKLLWPEKRLGEKSIKVTPRETVLGLRSLEVTVPKGTPVNLLANIDLRAVMRQDTLLERLEHLLAEPGRLVRLVEALAEGERYNDELRALVAELLELKQAPDFIEDHGRDSHFGKLTDAENGLYSS